MPDFQEELLAYLKSRSAITDLVGVGNAARIYPDRMEQGVEMPYLVIVESGGENPEILSGTGGAGLVQSSWQIYSVAKNRKGANDLSEVVRLAPMQGFKGYMGTTFVNEVACPQHRDSDVDDPVEGSSAYRYWTRRVYDIWHTQATS